MHDSEIIEHTFDADQTLAVNKGCDLSLRLVAVSGPAGSGKTTLIRKIHEYCKDNFYSVVLCAPTGKAARRIKEATGIDAITIHKLLEYNRPGERDEKTGKALDVTKPKRDRSNPLEYKVVIVDEYAMVNHELHNNLMAAIPSGGVVRVFGDTYQLPPIEEYKVTKSDGTKEDTPFQKMLKLPHSIHLTNVYRQGEGSAVLKAADKIRKGHMPDLNQDQGDWYVRLTDRPIDVLKMYIREARHNGIDFGKIENQIITPTKKTWVGTVSLNSVLRNLLNPNPVHKIPLERHPWDKEGLTVGVGDKVVCTSNTYDMRDYFERFSEWTEDQNPIIPSYIPCPPTKQMLNGETGIVLAIHPDNSLEIDFGDRIVEVPVVYQEYWAAKDTIIEVTPMKDIDLAFALTTHKCQGSEYQNVCYILNKSSFFTQSRKNFYTAVTRARKRAVVFSDQRSMRESVLKVKA